MTALCKNGHDLTGDNGALRIGGSGGCYIQCRQCNRERAKAWRVAHADKLWRFTRNGIRGGPTLGTSRPHQRNRPRAGAPA